MQISNPAAGGVLLTLSNTEVFNGTLTADNIYQDLDLVAVVGSGVALVLLAVENTTSVAAFSARTKGDTDLFQGAADDARGAALCELSNALGLSCALVVVTNASGVIEIASGDASDTHIIDVIAFLAL